MSTITETTLYEQQLCLPLNTPQESITAPLLSNLILQISQIAERYQHNQDYLSKQLHIQITKALERTLHSSELPSNEELYQQVTELRMLLTNPLKPSLFRNPCLYDDLVLEEENIEELRTAHSVLNIPYEAATPHEFAKEVINWLETLSDAIPELKFESDEATNNTTLIVYVLPTTPQQALGTITNFQYIKQLSIQLRQKQHSVENLEKKLSIIDQDLEDSNRKQTEQFEALHRIVQESLGKCEKKLAAVSGQYAEAKEVMQTHLEHTKEQLVEITEKATILDQRVKSLEAQNNSQQNIISELQRQVGKRNDCALL